MAETLISERCWLSQFHSTTVMPVPDRLFVADVLPHNTLSTKYRKFDLTVHSQEISCFLTKIWL